MNSNSENSGVGAAFQEKVAAWFTENCRREFVQEKKIAIGEPPKDHKFDIVAEDNSIVVECKCYTWTISGNVPSAKMGFANEAAFYLSFLPNRCEKYIVMLRASHEKRNETLAEYYYRTNKHLLGNTKVAEFDPESNKFRVMGEIT